ncbi:hypothetical protein L596_012313 [Steinernema carpocapsae]|uniref:Uncharacterized protein n=1 Tax=Steinernema carpocapsae TaxID=34508 RepID=A0A4U5NXH5_STECR|nr:hypothetical protein L596_012313 [Steinernema carpocapsae]
MFHTKQPTLPAEMRSPCLNCRRDATYSARHTGWSEKKVWNEQLPGVWSELLGTRALQANRSEFCSDLGGKRSGEGNEARISTPRSAVRRIRQNNGSVDRNRKPGSGRPKAAVTDEVKNRVCDSVIPDMSHLVILILRLEVRMHRLVRSKLTLGPVYRRVVDHPFGRKMLENPVSSSCFAIVGDDKIFKGAEIVESGISEAHDFGYARRSKAWSVSGGDRIATSGGYGSFGESTRKDSSLPVAEGASGHEGARRERRQATDFAESSDHRKHKLWKAKSRVTVLVKPLRT